jgi:hypothetical protein
LLNSEFIKQVLIAVITATQNGWFVIDSFNIWKNDGTDPADLCSCRNCCTSDRYADDELAKMSGYNKETSQSIEIQVICKCEDKCMEEERRHFAC